MAKKLPAKTKTQPAIREQQRPAPPIGSRFKPGQSGNPTGRPSQRPLTVLLKQAQSDGRLDKLFTRVMEDAIRGPDMKLAATVLADFWDRLEGKAIARTELTGADGGPMEIAPAKSREELEQRIRELLERAQARLA